MNTPSQNNLVDGEKPDFIRPPNPGYRWQFIGTNRDCVADWKEVPITAAPSAFKQAEQGTSRTDALMRLLLGIELTMPSLLEHARTLERELNDWKVTFKRDFAALTAERDELKNADWQLHLRLKERRDIFFGDLEGHYVSRDKLDALQQKVEEMTKERERWENRCDLLETARGATELDMEGLRTVRQQLTTALAQVEMMRSALNQILTEVPACDGNGGLYHMHHDENGKELGPESIDPMAVIQHLQGIAHRALSPVPPKAEGNQLALGAPPAQTSSS